MNYAILSKQMIDYFSELENQYGFCYEKNKHTETLIVPKEIGSGYISAISPCDNVELSIMHVNLLRPIVMYYEGFDCMFETTYCFHGHISHVETGVLDKNLRQNELGMYIKSYNRGMMMYPSGEEIFAVSIVAKNHFYNHLPFKEECTCCRNIASRDLVNALMSPRKTSVQIHNLFSQIVENSLDDELQSVYLEGVSKTILSMLWQNNVVNTLKGIKDCGYCSADQNAIREAEHILIENYEKSPTISELSKMVGLNEYKLKNGFREILGKTIYEYVRKLRMKNAKHLLENDNFSISQVAYMVGYINTSHFARAFKKEYGLNPSDLRRGA